MQEENNSTNRKSYTAEQKFKIVKEQLTTKTSIVEICKKYGIPPGNFHRWVDQFYANALDGFKNPKSGPSNAELREIALLKKENERMKNVISEIVFENVGLKKRSGELGLSD